MFSSVILTRSPTSTVGALVGSGNDVPGGSPLWKQRSRHRHLEWVSVPLDDAGLQAKFLDLVGPVLGAARARELAEHVWAVDQLGDVAPLIEAMAKPA